MHLKPLHRDQSVTLRDRDAHPPRHAPAGSALDLAVAKEVERLSKAQRMLHADGRFALLIILQGRDAAGKDGTIRHVFSAVDPQGCSATSFKVPTPLEQSHDFLWRIHQAVPPRGMIGIFNRSHYEDVLVPRVHGTLPRKVIATRYGQINAFEQMLTQSSVVILKFFLHVSREEQKRRLTARLTDEKRNWKFSKEDLADRARWGAYTSAYRHALRACTTSWAPWYIVPADDKTVRNWLVARTIAATLEGLDLHYPPADPKVLALKVP